MRRLKRLSVRLPTLTCSATREPLRASPDEGADARSQLFVRDGLHHVVVGAGIEPSNDRFGVTEPRVEQHGCTPPAATQLLQNLESVSVSELQVENDSVVLVDERERPGFLAARGQVYRVGLILQHAADQLEDCAIVVDYENSHSTFAVIESRLWRNV